MSNLKVTFHACEDISTGVVTSQVRLPELEPHLELS